MSEEQIVNPVGSEPKKDPPIIIIPDATYLDDTGQLTVTDVIIVKDLQMFAKMQEVLAVWGKEPLGVPGTRNGVEG